MKSQFTKNILPIGSILRDVLHTLDSSPIGVVFFTNDQGRVQGIMTDGDVRRTLLKGTDLNTPAQEFIVRNFIYGKAGDSKKEHLRLLNDEIRHLPILNDENRIVDFLSVTDFVCIPVMEPSLTGNELDYVVDCIKSNWISSQGKYVKKFEDSFADYHNVPYALTTSNGTTALHLALTALGIGSEDEVIVPDLTFAASAASVVHCGARPVFVDVNPTYWNMEPNLLEHVITARTRAIMPVHLYGHPCDMEPIMEFAKKYNLFVVEDCAEALGARYKGVLIGTFGDVGCFSFFSNKIITTGEGGMVITHNADLNDKMELLRDHGMRKERRYWHEVAGFNYRMTNLQAAIGLAQMEQLDIFIKERRDMALQYSEELRDIAGVIPPSEMPWAKNIYWLYSILVDEKLSGLSRDRLMLELRKDGIDARPLFYPLHEQPPFFTDSVEFPVTKMLSERGLSLPSSNSFSNEMTEKVCSAIKKIIRHNLSIQRN